MASRPFRRWSDFVTFMKLDNLAFMPIFVPHCLQYFCYFLSSSEFYFWWLKPNANFDSEVDSYWSVDRLREYFVWIHHEFQPQLSLQAASLLQRYYVWRRRHVTPIFGAQQTTLYGRSTLRLLESLVRLAKAHARLMARRIAGMEVSFR